MLNKLKSLRNALIQLIEKELEKPSRTVPGDAWQGPYVRPPARPDAGLFPLSPEDAFATEEARHRNELASRTLTPVPGMDDFMHDVIREARRQRYREVFVLEEVRNDCQITKPGIKYLFDQVDAVIEREGE